MEEDPSCYQDAAKLAAGEGLGAEMQLDDVVGTHPDYNEEEEEQKYFRRKRLGVVKNVLAASLAAMLTYGVYLGLLQMQLILHYDETYREVKYSNMELEDIDRKVLMGINVTPVVALLYTPVLIRFFGTKWTMFLAVGIYALFVSSNYWERYFTLVPSAVAIGVAIVPLWASMGHYITRMAQKYYEYANYKEEHVQEQRQAPRGACSTYVVIFQTIFYACFHLSFVCAQMPMLFFLNNYLYQLNHTLYGVKHCGTLSHGTLPGFNKTVLHSLPRSVNLIIVESVLMAAAFLAMLVVSAGPGGKGWVATGASRDTATIRSCCCAARPTGPPRRLTCAASAGGTSSSCPSSTCGTTAFATSSPSSSTAASRCSSSAPASPWYGAGMGSGRRRGDSAAGATLSLSSPQNYGVCALGLEKLAYLLMAYGFSASACSSLALCTLRLRRQCPLLAGAFVHAAILVTLFCWAPEPRHVVQAPLLYSIAVLWGMGSALNKTGISILLGMLYEDKERQDFVFTIYHWWQALAIFTVYLWSGLPMKAKLSIMLLALGLAAGSYLWMERKLAQRVSYRLPRIPRPRHKMKGYRYLEDDDSDETASEGEGASRHEDDDDDDDRHPAEANGGDELPKDEGEGTD
ncbi:protein unc-93 homolog B1 isoform X1 [Anser cygnoides]|uniref:protein unc-93 homolog B1 isoform X1 n=1 Tax=Anser cygnoides TaxID=8845 RepID=UPI0034D1AF3B